MSRIKFLIQGKSNSTNTQVYLRLSISKAVSFKRKTGYAIDFKDWSASTGYPKTNSATNKNLKTDLKKLESGIEKELNLSNTNGILVNSIWLKEAISKCLGKEEVTEINGLVSYTENYIKNLKYSTGKNGEKGVSIATIKKRKTILNKLIKFEIKEKRKLKIKDVDLSFRKRFIDFLDVDEKLSEGTIGRYLKEVKTICTDAQKNNVSTSPQLIHFKGFSSTSHKTFLSFEEIEKIESTDFIDKQLSFTRDWLVIGCYTGQRVSDLMRMKKSMIVESYGYDFINLTQKKTGKLVQIPVHQKVKQVLNSYEGDFPPVFSNNASSNSAMFNRFLKLVCEKAGLTDLVLGKLRNKDSERLEEGKFAKYKLVSSHICRRSFATNFYAMEKYPTPLLMNITAHGTEKMFLSYIGKKSIDYGLQLAKIWEKEK
jgi:integrase